MQRSLHNFIRQIRESDLSFSQVNTMFRLYHRGASSVNQLARHLGVTKAAVSQLLDSLIAAGLIERSENPEDRRMKLIALTEEGRSLVRRTMKTRNAWLEDFAQNFSEEEKAQILPALELMIDRIPEFMPDRDCPWKHQKGHKKLKNL
ncbi:MAG: MarR family transcriptional regulator [Anaerolineaceae bacterium]|nr:MarR family transcriptional regulator [Anaerolineaceae bacterium]